MTNIRRFFREGDISFLTHVTEGRKSILTGHFKLLWQSIGKMRERQPFELIAWVVLPDHMHLIIDPQAGNVSSIMKRIKLSFSTSYRDALDLRAGRVWQNRFWDHIIRDQDDMNRHIDYIHYNPVKHGLVPRPLDYQYSSMQAFYSEGIYREDWGVKEDIDLDGEFGE